MNNKEPRYWTSLEDLHQTEGFLKSQSQEFTVLPAKTPLTELERRDFLKLMGTSLLFASAACARRPVEKIIPYVNQPEEITPGIANWYASTCSECATGCGIVVKTREGRPIKLEGNRAHPVNQGGLCARGQASLYDLYSPQRMTKAYRIEAGVRQELALEEVDRVIMASLQQAGGGVYFLSSGVNSPTTQLLIGEFLQKFGGGGHVQYDPAGLEEIGLANEKTYGSRVVPRYRFDRAKVIVSFGADFLGTWLSPVEYSKGFSRARRVEDGKFNHFTAFEGVLTLTGMNADRHVPLRSGDEVQVALALAHQIIVRQGRSVFASSDRIRHALEPYSVAAIASRLGLDAHILEDVATRLWEHRGESLVVGGSPKMAQALALNIVVNLLNSALDSDGATVDWKVSPSHQAQGSYAGLLDLVKKMQAGEVKVLFINNANPVYSLANSVGFKEALQRIPLIVSLTTDINETALASHYAIPISHGLESWGDAAPRAQVWSLFQPTILPLFGTRSLLDHLLTWGAFSVSSHDYLKSFWKEYIYPQALGSGSFEAFWNGALKGGFVAPGGLMEEPLRLSAGRTFDEGSLSAALNLPENTGLRLGLYPSLSLYDGAQATNPWLQELPDPLSKLTWENSLGVAPSRAAEQGLVDGDIVVVQGDEFSFELPVVIQPKLHHDTVMAAIGYGRSVVGEPEERLGYQGQDFGVIGLNAGTNVHPSQKVEHGLPRWSALEVSLTKTGMRTRLAQSQSHHLLEGRNIIKDATYQAYQQDPHAGNTHHEKLMTLWPVHEYKGHRWGMAIDLTLCTGCSGCMIGCQSENNIPNVGKEQVAIGRDMHWLRIDRYYKGDPVNPDVAFQPMLCQHCENAPCETVCPVLATVHNDEGLNTMIYNRCVGTRYCSNNCPYKVRRFNFFNFQEQYVSPLNQMLNPDISTRSQGVMEKCTFCQQRIRTAKDLAKDQGRTVADGEVQTACQQSCPTDAIIFGDLNDPNSHVSQLTKSPRGYHVLEELNVRPQVTYLTKIRDQA